MPEERAYTGAVPPASAMSAARFSISRSTAYGAVSPLSPQPRRSSLNTSKFFSSSAGWSRPRSQMILPTTMIGWPSPNRSKAIWELSCEVTEFNSPSLHDVELEVGHINTLDDPRALELDGDRAQTAEKSNALTEQDGRDKVA